MRLRNLILSMLLALSAGVFAQDAPGVDPPNIDQTVIEDQVMIDGSGELLAVDNGSDLLAQIQAPPTDEVVSTQVNETPDEPAPSWLANLWAWLQANFLSLIVPLLAFLEVIVRLTPTDKDNAWFAWLTNIIDFLFPNRKRGGGTHTAN